MSRSPPEIPSRINGTFSLNVEPGVYRLHVVAGGFQPYRTGNIDVAGSNLAADVSLTPAIDAVADLTIYIDESGFTPSLITVKPDSVVEWVNVGLGEHAVTGSGQDSGLLETGESYKARFMSVGTFDVADGVEPQNRATIVVSNDVVAEMTQIYLPIVVAR